MKQTRVRFSHRLTFPRAPGDQTAVDQVYTYGYRNDTYSTYSIDFYIGGIRTGLSGHRGVPFRQPAFETEFEFGELYFNGLIGLLARAPGGVAFTPWCPAYPSDLYSDSSDEDGSSNDNARLDPPMW